VYNLHEKEGGEIEDEIETEVEDEIETEMRCGV
jgi:hypothetical protein